MGFNNVKITGLFVWAILGIAMGVAFANIGEFFSINYKYMALIVGGISTGIAVILMKYRETDRNHFIMSVSLILVLSLLTTLPFYALIFPLLAHLGPIVFGATVGISASILFLVLVRNIEELEIEE